MSVATLDGVRRALAPALLVTALAVVVAGPVRADLAVAAPAPATGPASVGAPPPAPPLPVPEQPPEEVRRTADDVLARQEYQQPPKPWFQQAQEAVLDVLGRFLGSLFEGGAGTAAAWILVGLIVAALAYFGLRIGRTVRPDPGTKIEVEVTPKTTPAEWRARAESFEAQGDYKQALRCRYRALIGELVDRDLVRDIPGRTAGEYRLDVAGTAPEAEAGFAGASDLFEAAWYGDEPTGPDENRRFRDLADDVLVRVGSS